MASLRFAAVWKRYGTVEAVRDLNLSCPQGEMLALLGPSGCGKSTTLKMLAGIEDLSEGEIYFDGEPVSRLSLGSRQPCLELRDPSPLVEDFGRPAARTRSRDRHYH